jgi:hypothetical protein
VPNDRGGNVAKGQRSRYQPLPTPCPLSPRGLGTPSDPRRVTGEPRKAAVVRRDIRPVCIMVRFPPHCRTGLCQPDRTMWSAPSALGPVVRLGGTTGPSARPSACVRRHGCLVGSEVQGAGVQEGGLARFLQPDAKPPDPAAFQPRDQVGAAGRISKRGERQIVLSRRAARMTTRDVGSAEPAYHCLARISLSR